MDNAANQNPVASVGREGSHEFNEIVTGNPGDTAGGPQAGQQPSGQQTTPPADQTPPAQDQGQGQGQGQQQTPPTTTPPATPPPTTQPGVDAIVKSTIEATLAGLRSQQQQQTAPAPNGPKAIADLSPQEFNQRFNVTRADEGLVATILGQDPKRAAAALDVYGQNLVRQAVTMAMEVANARVESLHSEITPHLTSWQAHQKSMRDAAAETEFYTAHPDLANEKELINTIKDSLVAQVQNGTLKFTDKTQAFSAVATAARSLLTKLRGGTQAPQTGQRQQNGNTGQGTPPASGGRTMSAASTAGRSGSGQAAAKSDVENIFGDEFR